MIQIQESYFIRNTHWKEVLQISTESEQQDLEGVVEIVFPLDVTVDYTSLFLGIEENEQMDFTTLIGNQLPLIHEWINDIVNLFD